MTITDIAALGRLGRERNVLTCVDGTFASPLAQQPLTMGVDFSVHSWYACSTYRRIGICVSVAVQSSSAATRI